jgi:D-tyrosyl-tRNA(Tyr) deacylase
MRALVQRVSKGSVDIEELSYHAHIGKGMVILFGIKEGDTDEDLIYIADKCSNLRIFEDSNDKMNISLKEIDGEVLIISQFTLYGDTKRGNRPDFTAAANPVYAEELYNKFIQKMKINLGEEKVKHGVFGAMMMVEIHNDGPVTILIESKGKGG